MSVRQVMCDLTKKFSTNNCYTAAQVAIQLIFKRILKMTGSYPGHKNYDGFSLLELIIVLAIMGLMMGLTVPWLSGSASHMILKSTARKTAAALRYARSVATTENIPIASIVDMDRQQIVITREPKQVAFIEQNKTNDQALKYYQPPAGIQFRVTDSDTYHFQNERLVILFFPSGNSSGGTFYIQNDKKHAYRIHVDPITGTVRIES